MKFTTNEKVFGIIVILLLLWLLLKKALPTGATTSKLVDPLTGLNIGDIGTSTASINLGEVLLPPGIQNNRLDAGFQHAVQNPDVPLCPNGSSPVLDPNDNKAYCLIGG